MAPMPARTARISIGAATTNGARHKVESGEELEFETVLIAGWYEEWVGSWVARQVRCETSRDVNVGSMRIGMDEDERRAPRAPPPGEGWKKWGLAEKDLRNPVLER